MSHEPAVCRAWGRDGPTERHARMIRSWHLAILRLAVTRDNADRLGVLAVAAEIDGLGGRGEKPPFNFFRRASIEICDSILWQNPTADRVLRRYLAGVDDIRLKNAFVAALATEQPQTGAVKRRPKRDDGLWRGLPSRGVHVELGEP
jgi:hypothetical protein